MLIRRDEIEPIDFGGLRIFDYTAGSDTDSSLAVIEVPAGARHAEAWSRRSDKYYLVTAGAVRFVLEGEATHLRRGDFCLVKQGRRFSYTNDSGEAAQLVLVHTPSFDLDAEVFVQSES